MTRKKVGSHSLGISLRRKESKGKLNDDAFWSNTDNYKDSLANTKMIFNYSYHFYF